MAAKLSELRPNRSLLDPDFNGYKLSLEKIPLFKKEFEISVDRVSPSPEQYSLLHVRLFGLHNFLFTDHFNSNDVYFIDKSHNVQKITLNKTTGRLADIKKVWEIPYNTERFPGNYNTSLHFLSKNLVVLSDGINTLHLINTGDRSEESTWQSVFSDNVLDQNESFIIQDAVLRVNETNVNEIHCLLVNIARQSDKFSTVLSWISLVEDSDKKWNQVSLRILQANGALYYCALESNCKYIYVASDEPFHFKLDSENPVKEIEQKPTTNKVYTWTQTPDDIVIKFKIASNCSKTDFVINTQPTRLIVQYKNTVLLEGNLLHRIDSDLSTWDLMDNYLEVTVIKSETGLMWTEFIVGDELGEQIVDPNLAAEIHEKLAHLCSENEVNPAESGPTFSAQQIEECDFNDDNTTIFERICCTTHNITHRTNLGAHPVLMSVKLSPMSPPSLAVRHDVDACLWTPHGENTDEWSLKHDGTLLAFGYVQASKQQRKFSTCSPDLSYSVICESSRHVFIYRQNRAISSGELRNRRSGSRIGTIAEQQVVSLDNDEILGISANNEILYLLTENYILALKIQYHED